MKIILLNAVMHCIHSGTHMKQKRIRYACAPPGGSVENPIGSFRSGLIRRLRLSVPVAMILLLLNTASAQNLIINGTVNNTGKIRVKNQTVIAQSAVGGELELTGSDQSLPAKQYQSVRLSGTGIKTSSGGDFSIQKNLTIAAAVTLQIPKGNIVALGDSVFELGIFKGAIQKSVNLTGSTVSSNFGNIGAAISWNSNAPGITNIIRASDSVQIGNGNQSIKRYYQIQPTDATAIGTVTFKYADIELNGHTASNLQLWRSVDNGANWQRYEPVVDTLLKTLTKPNVALAGRWAMADTVRALGPLKGAAGIPVSIAAASSIPVEQVILTTLDTLKVRIADIFGTPVGSVTVKFAVISRPAQAVGMLLSDTSVTTNASGIASTLFTLGSKVGEYEVIATAPNLDTVRMKTKARHGIAQALASLAITPQIKPILSTLDTAFTVTVADIGGNPVDSTQVHFALVNIPLGSFGEAISDTTVRTDSLGRASTILTLGSKIASYKVRAKVAGVNDSITFSAQSTVGAPASIARSSGNAQSGVNGTTLGDPFVISVFDLGGNPVPNDSVEFKLQSNPYGAVLSKTMAPTDALGQASTMLTLGTRTGLYAVSARSTKLVGPLQFTATAVAGSAASLAEIQGNNQSSIVSSTLASDFVVRVLDANGNNVPNDTVAFTIDSIPNVNAVNQSLTVSSVITDTSGLASTRLTLGNKTGDYVVNARVNNRLLVTFKANAKPSAPASLAGVLGNNQSMTIGSILTSDFVVRVLDVNGNFVSGAAVTFAIDSIPNPNATGQTLSKLNGVSDDSGLVPTRFTLGNKTGDYVVNAKVNGTQSFSFRANAKAGAAVTFAEIAGNSQTMPILTPLQNDFVVRVIDIGGNSVSNAPVQFTIESVPANSTGQRLTIASASTDLNGLARASFTIGNKVGRYTIRASSAGIPDTLFTATATHGAAAAMIASAGLNQTQQILSQLNVPFSVRVVDIGDNAVPLKNVLFTITDRPAGDTSASLSCTNAGTDSNGTALSQFTLGSKVGTYRVKAIISTPLAETQDLGSKRSFSNAATQAALETTFTAQATHGAAAAFVNVTGNQQIRPTGTTLDTAFALSIHDIGGNIVPGANVRFAITGVPANATGQSLKDTLVLSDTLGNASTIFTVGDREGTYAVTASVSGSVSTLFTTNGYYIYGDPNNDASVNIADITTIIDRMNGNSTFTFADSVKADMDKDGNIDTSDVNSLVGTILDRPMSFLTLPPFIPNNTSLGKSGGKPESPSSAKFFTGAKTQFETTPLGLRLNMENTIPVRGIEVHIRLKDSTVNVSNTNYLFSRAEQMKVLIKTSNREIRLLAYSPVNSEIQPGDGTILRIPKITSISQIETTLVILSVASNTAVTPEAIVVGSTPGKYPLTYRLEQNYPNPFNGSTTIQYEIPDTRTTESKIAIQIFNVLGQKVKTLINSPHDPGQYRITWNGTDDSGIQVASGIYFYRLITKSHLTTKKMIYVK